MKSTQKHIDLIIRGGWPGNLGLTTKQAALLPVEYLNAVVDDDVYRIDGIKRDTTKMRLLLRSLADGRFLRLKKRYVIRRPSAPPCMSA